VSPAARIPARYDASAKPKLTPARLGRVVRAGRRNINRLRVIGCEPPCCVLKLEAVTEDEVKTLCAVLTNVFVEFRRGLCLHVANLRAEAVANLQEAGIGAGVP